MAFVSEVTERIARLERLVETLRRRVEDTQYDYPARKQDGVLKDAVDRAARVSGVAKLDLFDDLGAADAAVVTSETYTDTRIASLSAVYQPLDADLTAIAALTTTSYGRSFLTLADASAARTLTGSVIGTDVQAFNAKLASIAALANASGALTNNGSGTFSYVPAVVYAPSTVDYLVKTLDAGLSAERAVTDTLSITWDWATGGAAKANVVFGTTSTTVCVGNDARLSDARTPTSHGSSHRPGGSDPIYSAQTYTPSSDVTRRSFDCTTVTTQQLADVVATMLRDKTANKEPGV